jgi:uncharacterized protein YbjQ (UPF0145 family)
MIDLIVLVVLLAVGYIFGRSIEQAHYRSIRKRESCLNKLPAIATRKIPAGFPRCKTTLVAGSVVISVDYFKKFVAGLRYLVGGRVSSYESLIDRARREAVLRMKASAENIHASHIFNVKMETASISKGHRNSIGSVEVLAYGTAVITAPEYMPAAVEGEGRLISVSAPGEKISILKAIAKSFSVILLLVLFIVAVMLFYSGPELTVNMLYFDTARVGESFLVTFEVSNENDEAMGLGNISVYNSVLDNFDVVYASPSALSTPDLASISDDESTSWYMEYAMEPGEKRTELFSFTPKKAGTFPLELEVCNEFQACTYYEPIVTVTE